jgi:hypothetical protein
MITVYRPDGVAELKEPVDARECVAHCGYSLEPVVVIELPEAGESPSVAKRKAAPKGSDVGLD